MKLTPRQIDMLFELKFCNRYAYDARTASALINRGLASKAGLDFGILCITDEGRKWLEDHKDDSQIV